MRDGYRDELGECRAQGAPTEVSWLAGVTRRHVTDPLTRISDRLVDNVNTLAHITGRSHHKSTATV
ncbi:hypothetical protein [Dyella sp. C11]|uniref:hypothetical protein n=1 Tax=Dyella sp. C11 TaxID=2126991 RepID=UPI000D6448B0|nr:hypothetical protein [Dyella sp. C11]